MLQMSSLLLKKFVHIWGTLALGDWAIFRLDLEFPVSHDAFRLEETV
jgi:hypothetical protein